MSNRQYTALVTREGDVWSGFVYGVPGPVVRRTLDEIHSELIAGVAVMTSTYDEPIMLTLVIAPQGVPGEWQGTNWVPSR